MTTNIEVYLDMDGVLAGFDQRIEKDVPLTQAQQELTKVLQGLGPTYQNLSMDKIKSMVKGQQTDPGLKALKKAYHNVNDRKYALANAPHFFLNLPVLPGAQELFEGVLSLTGKKPHILTAPMESNKQCAEEKQMWIDKHFGNMYSTFNCTKDKYKFAKGSKSNILIDDREKYVDPFVKAGGSAVLYTGNAQQALDELQNLIDMIVGSDEQEPQPMKENALGPVSYTALVLSRSDHERLKNSIKLEFEDFDTFSNGWEMVAHHVTLNMGSFKGDRNLLGGVYPIQVLNFAKDNLVAAVGVNIPPELPAKENPHITMAVNRSLGGKPALSNKLNWTMADPLKNPLTVQGTLLEVRMGDNDKFSDEY